MPSCDRSPPSLSAAWWPRWTPKEPIGHGFARARVCPAASTAGYTVRIHAARTVFNTPVIHRSCIGILSFNAHRSPALARFLRRWWTIEGRESAGPPASSPGSPTATELLQRVGLIGPPRFDHEVGVGPDAMPGCRSRGDKGGERAPKTPERGSRPGPSRRKTTRLQVAWTQAEFTVYRLPDRTFSSRRLSSRAGG